MNSECHPLLLFHLHGECNLTTLGSVELTPCLVYLLRVLRSAACYAQENSDHYPTITLQAAHRYKEINFLDSEREDPGFLHDIIYDVASGGDLWHIEPTALGVFDLVAMLDGCDSFESSDGRLTVSSEHFGFLTNESHSAQIPFSALPPPGNEKLEMAPSPTSQELAGRQAQEVTPTQFKSALDAILPLRHAK